MLWYEFIEMEIETLCKVCFQLGDTLALILYRSQFCYSCKSKKEKTVFLSSKLTIEIQWKTEKSRIRKFELFHALVKGWIMDIIDYRFE